MIRKKILITALSGVLVGGSLLAGGMAFADDAASVGNNLAGKIPFLGKVMKHRGGPGWRQFVKAGPRLSPDNLNQLVKEGVINQEKADEIQAYIDKTMEKKTTDGKRLGKRSNLLSGLVENNVLTQEQADSIKTKLLESVQEQKQQQISDKLKALVEKGVITQEQADKILAKVDSLKTERAALGEKFKHMTPEERRQFKPDNKKSQNPLSQLVAEGTITQEQAKAIGGLFINRGGHRVKWRVGQQIGLL